ncbi:MAG: hypothetical protein RBR85_01080 [Bacilli bacterium]|nr:hypothetical protein [Bacilli bacterium]
MIPLQEFNNLLAKYGWIFALIIAIVLAVVIAVLLITNKSVKKTKDTAIYDYLGGKSNVLSLELKGSRLNIKLQNAQKIDEKSLHEAGVKSIISMNEKIVLVLSPKLKKNIEKLL